MGAAEQRKKDSNMASYMKKHKIERKVGRHCPFSCGALFPLGEKALFSHIQSHLGFGK